MKCACNVPIVHPARLFLLACTGANIGLFALRLLLDPQLAPSVQHVYAFEPLPLIADVLEANLQEHGLTDKVWGCLHCAVLPAQPLARS